MPAEEQRSGGHALRCARRPDVPPWKGGQGDLTSRHQTTGRVRVFATANTWRTQRMRRASGFRAVAAQHSKEVRPKDYQGILRCRAGAGGQGKPSGDGKPAGPDRPLGKGVGGIKKERAERQGLGQRPNTKKESPQTNV